MTPLLGIFIFSMIIAGSLKHETVNNDKHISLQQNQQFEQQQVCETHQTPAGGWLVTECEWRTKVSKANWNELVDDWVGDYKDWE